VSFLLAVLDHPRFRDGGVDTQFLDREAESIVESERAVTPPPEAIAAAVAAADDARPAGGASSASPDPWSLLEGWRN
jgi:acetyl/propionyl-CoA carboxylase alpha subunit